MQKKMHYINLIKNSFPQKIMTNEKYITRKVCMKNIEFPVKTNIY